MGVNSVTELSPGEVSQQEWVCIPNPVSWSGVGVCDSPQRPGSRVTQSWVRRGPYCRGDGVRRQPVKFPRWVNWSISPWWKPQGEPGVKWTLGGDTKDRQGAALLAELIRRRPGGMLGSLLPQHAPPGSPTGSHPPADRRVHLLPGAGKDSATAAEHPAQAVHPGSALGVGQEGVGQSWLATEGTSS